MKTDWRRLAQIASNIYIRYGKEVKIRGYSAEEIARKLITDYVKYLKGSEIKIIRRILNKEVEI